MKLKSRKKGLLITVDGPGGVGKSTAAKALAKKYVLEKRVLLELLCEI